MEKKNFEKFGKIQKKSEKIRINRKKIEKKKIRNNQKNNQYYLYICIYDILAIFDQSWKKKERRRRR